MSFIRNASTLCLLVGLNATAVPAIGQVLYSENFVGTGAMSNVGWTDTSVEAGFAGLFDHSGSAVSNEAVTPDGLDTGAVFHYINVNGTRAITTTEFSPINVPSGGLDIVWYQTEDALVNGSIVDVHPAVMVGGQWYATAKGYSTADTTAAWQRQVLAYSNTSALWRTLTLNAGSASLGAAPGANLSGSIQGLGLVSVMNMAAVGNETVWYDYIEIRSHLIPGDVDGLNGVTTADYQVIRNNYRTVVTSRAQGDLNADGFVDVFDFREWKGNYSGSLVGIQAVPEPTSAWLVIVALLTAGTVRTRNFDLGIPTV